MPLNSVETKKLEVVEACSGIRSLMTLMTLAVVFAYFSYPRAPSGTGKAGDVTRKTGLFNSLRSWGFWRSTLILLSAVPIAILTNALRVSGTGILAHYYGVRVADGFFHSFSGWVIYIVAFLLLFAFGWGLDRLVSLFSHSSRGARAALEQIDSLKPAVASTPKVAQSEGAD
jgi:exosortase/archaeosortase family protein